MTENSKGRDFEVATEARDLAKAIKRVGLGAGWDRHSIAMGWLLARGAGDEVFGFDGLVNRLHEALKNRGMG